MNDEQLTEAQEQLAFLNDRNTEISGALDNLEARAAKLKAKIQECSLEASRLSAERAEVKARYNDLYETVGRELKRREQVARDAAKAVAGE